MTAENKEVCFTIQVSLRNAGERLHRNLPAVRQHGPQATGQPVATGAQTSTRPGKAPGGTTLQAVSSLGMGQTAWRTILVQCKVRGFAISWDMECQADGGSDSVWHRQVFPHALETAQQSEVGSELVH